MFRIKNVRGTTVGKPHQYEAKRPQEIAIPPKKIPANVVRPASRSKKPAYPKIEAPKPTNYKGSVRPPSRHKPTKLSSIYEPSQLKNIDTQLYKRHPHKLGLHAEIPPKLSQRQILNKIHKQESKQLPTKATTPEQTQPKQEQHEPVQTQPTADELEALRFLEQKQKAEQERREKQNEDLALRQKEEQKIRKQRQAQRIAKKQREKQQDERRQKEAEEQIALIKKRREERAQERQRQKKEQEERARKMEELMSGGHGGMMYTDDPLAHFELSDLIMDAQIKKILKTSFSYFPSGNAIENKKQELERIESSYEMIRSDPSNARMAEGLKNFRIQLLNQIGELIMEDQRGGFTHPEFSILQSDTRSGPISKDAAISRGIPKNQMSSFMSTVECQRNQDCPICLQQISAGDMCSQLECGHLFHKQCGEDWLELTANCPSCRQNIKFGAGEVEGRERGRAGEDESRKQ